MGRASGRKNPTRAAVIEPDSPEGREIGESPRQDPAGSPIPGLTGNIVNYETVRRPVPAPESLPEFRGMMAHGVPPEDTTTEERAAAERGGNAPHRPPAPPKLHRERTAPVPVPVYIVEQAAGGRPIRTLAAQKITIPASGSSPARICGRDETRETMYVLVETAAGSTSDVSITPPSVPATGVAAQNTTGYPVSVVISANGATITNVSVNAVTVGTAAGTYIVPVDGAISIAYTVATPTWTWTEQGVPGAAPTGIRIDHEVGNLDVGFGALLRAGMASYQELKGCQDELFAVSNDGSACTISVIFLYGIAAGG